MTKVPMEKPAQGMGTLDKLWGTIPEEEDDANMMDMEEATELKSSKNMRSEEKTTKTPMKTTTTTTTTTYDKTTFTIPLFPMAVRFTIQAPSVNEAANQHIEILKTIAKNMDHCEIYSKDIEQINMESIKADHFDYHERRGRTKTYVVVHRLVLNEKYHQIKKTNDIFDCIKSNKCFIQEHMWTTKEWDIVNIGFLSGVSPKHQSKDSVQHKLELVEKTCLKYNLHTTLLTGIQNGKKFNTQAYEIQCQRKDAADLTNYIAHTSREYGQTFVKHKWKYTNPEVYINALHQQNDFIQNIRTIPIYGVTNEAMSTMYKHLIKKKEVLEVGSTSKTSELGRWNIYTKLSNFQSTTKWLKLNLTKMYNNLNSDIIDATPKGFVVEVRFNTMIVFDKEDDQLLQYAAQSVNSFSDTSSTGTWTSVGFNNRTWASVASKSQDTSSITTTSELSKTIQQLSESITRICSRLDRIEETLQNHTEAIARAQLFENECKNDMQKLVCFIERLENRTTRIQPRKLDDFFEPSEPNKRQNTNKSPQK